MHISYELKQVNCDSKWHMSQVFAVYRPLRPSDFSREPIAGHTQVDDKVIFREYFTLSPRSDEKELYDGPLYMLLGHAILFASDYAIIVKFFRHSGRIAGTKFRG